jgi:hypothetical protein
MYDYLNKNDKHALHIHLCNRNLKRARTVKKAVKLLEAPSRIAILMLNKYNSIVGIYCLSSCVFLFPPCC